LVLILVHPGLRTHTGRRAPATVITQVSDPDRVLWTLPAHQRDLERSKPLLVRSHEETRALLHVAEALRFLHLDPVGTLKPLTS
jgi:hypothetical protein